MNNFAEKYRVFDTIDKNIINYRGFRPEFIETSALYPDLVFVKSLNEIVIINIAKISENQISHVASIKSTATKSASPFEIAIARNGLIIINPL